jgi:hypothetical protein
MLQCSFHRYSFIPISVGVARFLEPIAWQRDNASILRIDFAESATDYRIVDPLYACSSRRRGSTPPNALLGVSSQVISQRSASILSAHPPAVIIDLTRDNSSATLSWSSLRFCIASMANFST